jgi:AcrR family transcriptional regulator
MAQKPTKTPRTGRPKGGSALANPALRAIRAQAIIEARAANTPVAELARRYKCSEQTIYRYITWAKKEGLLGELRERALEKLAPLALDAYESALRSQPAGLTPTEIEGHKMKLGAAKDVNFGIGVFSKHSESKSIHTEEHTLNWYLEQRNGKQAGSQGEVEGGESGFDSAIDAETFTEGSFESDELLGLPESSDSGDRGGAGDAGVGFDEGDGE